jgi:site-specific DNA recombinase
MAVIPIYVFSEVLLVVVRNTRSSLQGMSSRRIRHVAIYARLSVTTEESVSIERQVDAARKYADARSWEVTLVEVDDGVSATKTKPEERLGWRRIITSPEQYEAVIVWKVDRLARRVLDFLHADETLQARGAGIVAVEDPVDMTTAQGRAFATMLAVFGEMEAAAISARVTAARRALLRLGRRAGGRPPFGWMNIPNPAGPGFVLARDPERIGVVAALAERALAGESLYALARWLEAEGVQPRERAKRRDAGRWHEASLEAILRNPTLAGMTPDRGDVVRGEDGLPVIDAENAVLTPAEWRRLQEALDARLRPRAGSQGTPPAFLGGLVRCGTCGRNLHRAVAGRLPMYQCTNRACTRRVSVVRSAIEAHVEREFLAVVGRLPYVVMHEVDTDESLALADVEAAIRDTLAAMGADDADVPTLAARLDGLKKLRAKARATAESTPPKVAHRTGETFAEAWAAEDDLTARRRLLMSGIRAIHVAPATRRGGRGLDPARVRIEWED